MALKLNPDKHYLGTLCKREHDWEGTGKSLRYIKTNQCLFCLKNRRKCPLILKKERERARILNKRPEARLKRRAYEKEYRKRSYVKLRKKKEFNAYRLKNQKSIQEKHKQYLKDNPEARERYWRNQKAKILGDPQKHSDYLLFLRKHYQKSYWKEVIAWAKKQPEPEQSYWLEIVEQSVNERIKILDLKKEIRNARI